MSFCVRDKRTGEYWRSRGGKTAWGTGTGAKQAYAASHRDRLDDSKTHELVDMTQVGIQVYKDVLSRLVNAIGLDTHDGHNVEQLRDAVQEAKYLLGLEERPRVL